MFQRVLAPVLMLSVMHLGMACVDGGPEEGEDTARANPDEGAPCDANPLEPGSGTPDGASSEDCLPVRAQGPVKQDLHGFWASSGGQDISSSKNPVAQLTLTEAGQVTIDLTSSVDAYLYLTDQSGEIIASDDNGGDDLDARLSLDLASGTYQLIAATRDSDLIGEFDLTVDRGNLQFRDLIDIKMVHGFQWAYDDRGTGSDDDLTVYRPDMSGADGYHSLGELAINGRHAPKTTFVVRDSGDLLAPPTDYSLIWKDSGSGGTYDVSFWLPQAPAGYTCLGVVTQLNYSKPSTDRIRCIKSDHVLRGVARKVWDDSGSGADWDLGIWRAVSVGSKGLALNTFSGNRSHGDTGGDRYWVLNKDRINEPGFGLPADAEELARRYAPRVWMHADESYFPSSVEWFFDHTQLDPGDNRYVTNEALGCPSCTDPAFLDGQSPATESVPAYTMIVPKGDGVTDIVYWMFYPYNRGKRVCIGVYTPLGCVGGYSTFGHHVGDWEHATIRLVDGQPSEIYLSQHSHGQTLPWGDIDIAYSGTHVEMFSAKGSHGLYPDAGRHIYRYIGNGDFLADDTSAGTAWDTWDNLEVFDWQPIGEYALDWLNFDGRWGNAKDGCEIVEAISGECMLNGGPSGPMMKNAADPDHGELD